MDATNQAYGARDSRGWLRRRAMALVLTLVESVLVLAAALLIVLWPHVLGWLDMPRLTAVVFTVVQWVVVLVVLLTGFALAYYFGTDVAQEWRWLSPGSTVGVLTLIAATLGFRLYVEYWSSYTATYGTLAGVVVTLLWFYFAALALLLGAEVNGAIEDEVQARKLRGE
jgi:membrane protein